MKTASNMIDNKKARRKAKLPFRLQGLAKAEAEKKRSLRGKTVTMIIIDDPHKPAPKVPASKSLDAAIKRRPSPGPTVKAKKVTTGKKPGVSTVAVKKQAATRAKAK